MGKQTSVVIVDDDRGTRELLADLLEISPKFKCAAVYADAAEAAKGILMLKPDIVLMDINMPGMNGIECVRQLKPWLPETDFLMLTVYKESEFIFQALEAGAIGYLLKRAIGSDLIDRMEEAVAGGSPLDSSIARMVVDFFHRKSIAQSSEIQELSDRQMEILQLMSRGRSYKVIATELDLSIHTIHSYIRVIYEKLHVHSKAEAIAKWAGLDK